MQLTTIIVVLAIAAVIITRRINPLAGGVLGTLVPLGVAGWGLWAYSKGAGIAFAGVALSREMFLAICAGWLGLEVYGLVQALRSRTSS